MPEFKRGDIWEIDFDPQLGSEISKRRPALILSTNRFNIISEHTGVVIVVPGTSKRQENPRTQRLVTGYWEVAPSNFNGLRKETYFIAHQVRTVSIGRLKKRIGCLESPHRKQVAFMIAELLGLYEDLGQ